MGYTTEYKMTVRDVINREQFEQINDVLQSKEFDLIYYALDSGYYSEKDHAAYYYSWNRVKWYNCEENIVAISERLPDFTFKVTGYGEDPFDVWDLYCKNGVAEMCEAEVTIPKPQIIHWPEVNEANEQVAV